MPNLVAKMAHKSSAKVIREVGGFVMSIPVDFGHDDIGFVKVSVQVTGIPFQHYQENGALAAARTREAVARACTDELYARYSEETKQTLTPKLHELLSDVIIQKGRDTL